MTKVILGILLKVALNTITPNPYPNNIHLLYFIFKFICSCNRW